MLKVNTGDWLPFTAAPARERSLSPVHATYNIKCFKNNMLAGHRPVPVSSEVTNYLPPHRRYHYRLAMFDIVARVARDQ